MTKLPEPAAHLADSLPLFTEAQMLQFRRDALEEAAELCQLWNKSPGKMLAVQIRKLKDET